MSDDNENDNDNGGKISITMERETTYRNIWIMKLAFAILFAGLLSPSILQVYLTTAMRTGGFTLYFAFSILGAILIAPVLLKTKGCKFSILVGLGGYFIWVISSFYPSWITIMPALCWADWCFRLCVLDSWGIWHWNPTQCLSLRKNPLRTSYLVFLDCHFPYFLWVCILIV